MSPSFDRSAHLFHHPDYQSVVDIAVATFKATPTLSLPPARFEGAGVYAIYYTGDADPYAALGQRTREDFSTPIYVGKAIPAGGRRGVSVSVIGSPLSSRIRQHARSIAIAENLVLADFLCRVLIFQPNHVDLIVPVEGALINEFRPVWNAVVDGFGNHDPGSGRYDQRISGWDALHPGRGWVSRLTGGMPNVDLLKESVRAYLTA